MRLRNESVFTETFLNRIKGKQIVFARVDGALESREVNMRGGVEGVVLYDDLRCGVEVVANVL